MAIAENEDRVLDGIWIRTGEDNTRFAEILISPAEITQLEQKLGRSIRTVVSESAVRTTIIPRSKEWVKDALVSTTVFAFTTRVVGERLLQTLQDKGLDPGPVNELLSLLSSQQFQLIISPNPNTIEGNNS